MISKVTALALLRRKVKRRRGAMILKVTALALLKRKAQRRLRINKGTFGNKCGFKLWTRKQSRTAMKRSLLLNDIAIKKKHFEWAEIRRRMQKLAEKDKKVTKRLHKLSDANKKARNALKKLDNLKCHISSRIRKRNRLNTQAQFGIVPPIIPQTMVVDPIEVPILLDNGINNADGQEEVVAHQPIPNIEPQNQIADQSIKNSQEDGIVENESFAVEEESRGEEANEQESIPVASTVLTDTIPPQTLLAVASAKEENCGSEEDKIEPHQETPKESQPTAPKSLGDNTVNSDSVLVEDRKPESASIQQDSDQIQPVTILPNIHPQFLDSASTSDPATKETSSNPSSFPTSSDDPKVSQHNQNHQKSDSNPNVNPLSVADQDEGSENKVVENKPTAAEPVETNELGRLMLIGYGKLCIFYTTLFLKPETYWDNKVKVLKEIKASIKKLVNITEKDLLDSGKLLETRKTEKTRPEIIALYCALSDFTIGNAGQKTVAIKIILFLSSVQTLPNVLKKTEKNLLREIDTCVFMFIKISLKEYLDYHNNRQANSSCKKNPKFEWRSSLPNIQVPAEYPSFNECRLVKEGEERHTKYRTQKGPKGPMFAIFYEFLSKTTIKSKVLDLDFAIIETAITTNPFKDPMEFEKILFGGIFASFETLDRNENPLK